MLFSLKNLLLPAIGTLALLQCAVGRPLPDGTTGNDGLIERQEAYDNALLDRAFIDGVDNSLFERAPARGGIRKEAKVNPYSKGQKVAKTVQPARKPKQPQQGQHVSPKMTLGKNAREELDKMGLHGKARKSTIKWHKNQVKQQMRTHPALKGKAKSAVIEHVAHKGGSDPKEKNHITASFRDKNRQTVPNSFNGGKNFHLYVGSKGLNRAAKTASSRNNAQIMDKPKSFQTSVSKTRTPGKSSNKGKGKQNPGNSFSKNGAKKRF